MRRLTASLAATGLAALAVTGAGTAGKPVESVTFRACFDQSVDQIRATVSWNNARVTNGTFVVIDNDAAQTDTVVQWELPHGDRSGSVTEFVGTNVGFEELTSRLYAGNKSVATSHLAVPTMPTC